MWSHAHTSRIQGRHLVVSAERSKTRGRPPKNYHGPSNTKRKDFVFISFVFCLQNTPLPWTGSAKLRVKAAFSSLWLPQILGLKIKFYFLLLLIFADSLQMAQELFVGETSWCSLSPWIWHPVPKLDPRLWFIGWYSYIGIFNFMTRGCRAVQ